MSTPVYKYCRFQDCGWPATKGPYCDRHSTKEARRAVENKRPTAKQARRDAEYSSIKTLVIVLFAQATTVAVSVGIAWLAARVFLSLPIWCLVMVGVLALPISYVAVVLVILPSAALRARSWALCKSYIAVPRVILSKLFGASSHLNRESFPACPKCEAKCNPASVKCWRCGERLPCELERAAKDGDRDEVQ